MRRASLFRKIALLVIPALTLTCSLPVFTGNQNHVESPVTNSQPSIGINGVVTPTAISPSPNPKTSSQPPLPSQPALAATSAPPSLPDPNGYTWTQFVSGLNRPVELTNAGDDSGRLFVLEQAGIIRIVKNDQLQADRFLDIRDRVGSSGNEQGLLGLAFHPKFKDNGYFYVDYTDLSGNTVISRFTASAGSAGDHPTADPTTESILLHINHPFPNHNGGQLAFGPDHYLWIGEGDGGSQGDPNNNGQSVNSLLGKIMRIDVDNGSPYGIPKDNPFANGGGKAEIWAIGLRNPWRFTFDRLTGDLYIADVGQDLWEEIDYLPAGYNNLPPNFGWSIREGHHPFKDSNISAPSALIDPVFEYSHGQGCAVVGGPLYRGQAVPAFQGVYLFADNCSGILWGLVHQASGAWQGNVLFNTGLQVSSFGEDQNGEAYMLDLNGGIYRLAKK